MKSLGKKALLPFSVTPRGHRSGFAISCYVKCIYDYGRVTSGCENDVNRQTF